jgi:hypothetical protein
VRRNCEVAPQQQAQNGTSRAEMTAVLRIHQSGSTGLFIGGKERVCCRSLLSGKIKAGTPDMDGVQRQGRMS